jgi:ribosomal-protein-alanine N-acetyltransferase
LLATQIRTLLEFAVLQKFFETTKITPMIETERLLLRKMNKNDIDSIFAMRSDTDVMRYIREPQNRQESANWIELVSSKWKTHKIGFCAVILKETNELIGWCGLWVLAETGEIEVGYAIMKKFWQQGFAYETAKAFLDYGFNQLNLPKIVAVGKPENTGSRKVMEKLGMKFDHIGKYYELDLVHYTITKDEFFRN